MQTSRMRRASATERFHREAGRKRLSPIAVILGLIGAGLGVAIVGILFGGGDREDAFRARFERDRGVAAQKDSDGDLDGALAIYGELLDRVRERPAYRADAADLRATIATLRRERAERAAAVSRLRDYLARVRSAAPETAAALFEEGGKLLHAYARASLPLLEEVETETVRVEKLIPEPPPSPAEFRAKVEAKCSVAGRSGDFAGAIRLWDEYLERGIKEGWKGRAALYRDAVNRMAWESAQAIRRKADRLRASDDAAGAEALLRKERPRFEGTKGAAFLR